MEIQCFKCKWFDAFGVGCKAFPEGIPLEITEGEIEHNVARKKRRQFDLLKNSLILNFNQKILY